MVPIDYKLTGLIKDLWAIGIETYFSCQGTRKPYYTQAYVVMDGSRNAKLILMELIAFYRPSRGRMYFHNEWRIEYGYNTERKGFFIVLRFPQKDIPLIRRVAQNVVSDSI